MAYKIDPEKCVACGSCQGECPVGAISEGDVYSINPDECVECGSCTYICPAKRPLMQTFKQAKAEIAAVKAAKAAAGGAK